MVKNKGTSTCTILMLDNKTGKVYTASIGDSCYLILRLRKGKYFREFKLEEQMHESFNTPFQVGTDGDSPQMANTKTHQLVNNDIVITASDGYLHIFTCISLWDNLEIDRIIEIVNENYYKNNSVNPQELAIIIAEEAEKMSTDK